VSKDNIIKLIQPGNVEVLSVCRWPPGKGHEGAVVGACKLAGPPRRWPALVRANPALASKAAALRLQIFTKRCGPDAGWGMISKLRRFPWG
jgi:hypothetical protein